MLALKKIISILLLIAVLFSFIQFDYTNAEAASNKSNISITLNSITCVSNNHVGNEWSFGCKVNKVSLKEGGTVKVSSSTSDKISITATAVENDSYPDSNSKTLTIPVSKLKEGGNPYSLNVTVTEDRGRYSGNKATWKFSFTVKKVSVIETQTVDEVPKDKIRNGNDEYTWKDGTKYSGEWKNNKLNGKGTLNYANGDKYEGNFTNNKKSGEGTYTWKNGDIYAGNWSDDVMKGNGTYKFEKGDQYSGEWDAGFMNGKGTYTFKNGNKLTGIWVDNQYSSED